MRLITLSKYCKPIFEKVKNGNLSKEDAFDSIEKYELFLSQKVTLDMFIGENVIFKGFKIKAHRWEGETYIYKGNKYSSFTGEGTWNDSWSTVADLIKNDVDYIWSF